MSRSKRKKQREEKLKTVQEKIVPLHYVLFLKLKPFWKFISALIAGVATYVGLMGFFMAKLSAEVMEATDPKDPYTYAFQIKNEGSLDLMKMFYSCKIKGAYIDGRYSPPEIVLDKNQSMEIAPVIRGEVYRTLQPSESDSMTCKLFSEPFSFMLENKRQLTIVASYRPAYFPFHLEKEFSFSLLKATDGSYKWLPVANDRE